MQGSTGSTGSTGLPVNRAAVNRAAGGAGTSTASTRQQARATAELANAGVVEPVPTPAVTTEHYDKTFDINARGVYFTVQKALPLMEEGGSIIVNGSGAWQKGIPIYFAANVRSRTLFGSISITSA